MTGPLSVVWRRLVTAGAILGAAVISCTAAVAQEDWPSDPITIVVPFDAGGSADRMARTLADPLRETLGVPVTVENRPGGAGGLGATYVSRQPADGNTLLLMQATPYLANAILVGGAPVEWDDFRLLNAQWNDYAIVAVHKDSPYQSLEQLVEAMREPGKVSSGIIFANGGHLQTLMLMDSLDIPHENVRFVTYDGGSPLRTALAGNQVDFEVLFAQVGKLVGVYSSPHRVFEYHDGNRRHSLTLTFEAERTGGELCITQETTEVGYFSPNQMEFMDMMDSVHEQVADALEVQEAAFVR